MGVSPTGTPWKLRIATSQSQTTTITITRCGVWHTPCMFSRPVPSTFEIANRRGRVGGRLLQPTIALASPECRPINNNIVSRRPLVCLLCRKRTAVRVELADDVRITLPTALPSCAYSCLLLSSEVSPSVSGRYINNVLVAHAGQ